MSVPRIDAASPRKKARLFYHRLATAALLTGLVATFAAMQRLLPEWRLVSEPTHATVEGIGGLIAVVAATFLLHAERGGYAGRLFFVALGFISMGLLDIFHAATAPGNRFVFLHSVASLAGGFWFALAWFPWLTTGGEGRWKRWAAWAVAVGALVFWVWTLLAREALPAMTQQGTFTATAIVMNVLAGTFFMLAAARLLLDFHRRNELEIYALACMAGLFGLAGLAFPFSALWDVRWWTWHLLRLVAYVVVLGLALHQYYRTLSDLNTAVAEQRTAADALRRAEAEIRTLNADLERRIAERTAELKAASEELEQLFALSLDMICIANMDGFLKRLNAAWTESLGWTTDELLARPYLDFVHPEDQDATTREASRLATGEVVVSFENRYRCRDGSYRWLQWKSFPLVSQGLIYAIARDVTPQKRAEAEIRELNAELRRRIAEQAALNKELEAFSYAVSHDLRAPLRAIDGFSQVLLEDHAAQLSAEGQDCLRRVRQAAQRMGELIEALLTLSRITRTDLQRQTVNLSELARSVAAELQRGQGARAVELIITPDLIADGDGRLLRVVMENLLANAWKYTARTAAAHIEVGTVREGGSRTFFVRDNGVGFDMAHAEKLFGAFQRLHSAREYPGAGVGLATVQRIVHRHGGHVWAQGAVGEGATFYFTL